MFMQARTNSARCEFADVAVLRQRWLDPFFQALRLWPPQFFFVYVHFNAPLVISGELKLTYNVVAGTRVNVR
jgi:hypothetical protein